MDVVDLYDFVNIFGRKRERKNMATQASSPPETRIESSSSLSSSLTLPIAAKTTGDQLDLEKMATEKSHKSEKVADRVTTALDWTGPDDPENPENWSTAWKAYHVAYVGIQCFVMYVAHRERLPIC